MSKVRFAAVLAACLSAAPALAQSQNPAGHVLWAFGQVERICADGVVKRLAKGDPVFEGDVIRSAPGSHAQLVMSDEALLAVRAESSLKLSKYSYQGREDGTERAIIELLKGGMRSVTGAIGRSNKENYQLKNEMHVIGIRGTDHEIFATDGGTFNRVTLGGTYLQSPEGRVDLAPGEVGFVSMAQGSTPVRLERTPEFMQLAALSNGNTGPQLRASSVGDERRLQTGDGASALNLSTASPALPSKALGENSRQQGWSRGADPLKDNGKGRSK